MKFQVIYSSKTGNTKKVVEAIASELDVKVENVKKANLNEDCMAFLGSGCYGSKPAKIMPKNLLKIIISSQEMLLCLALLVQEKELSVEKWKIY